MVIDWVEGVRERQEEERIRKGSVGHGRVGFGAVVMGYLMQKEGVVRFGMKRSLKQSCSEGSYDSEPRLRRALDVWVKLLYSGEEADK